MGNRAIKAVVLALACGSIIFAQAPAPPASEGKPASIEGEVRNAATQEPLEHAHVLLRRLIQGPADRFGAITGADGKFQLPSLPPGDYILTVERNGYFDLGYFDLNDARTKTLHFAPDEKKTAVKLKLTPSGTITGRVFGQQGEPMEGITVGLDIMGRAQSSPTDDRGVFRIGGVRPGKYRVFARPPQVNLPPEIRTDGTAEVHYATTYYPNSLNELQAAGVVVAPGGETTGIDIHLAQTPIVRVGGKIIGLPPNAQGFTIVLDVPGVTPRIGVDGTFEIWRADPGRRSLRAICDCGGKGMTSAPVEVDVGDSDVDHVELRIVPPIELQGKVEYDDDDARPQSRQSQSEQGRQSVARPSRWISLRGNTGMGSPGAPIRDDSFHIANVPPGIYQLSIAGPVYVRSIQYGQTTINGSQLDLRDGAAAPLTIHVASATGSLSGTVESNSGPVAGARVLIVEQSKDSQGRLAGARIDQAATQADGTFKISNVAPGKYLAIAVDDEDMTLLYGNRLQGFEEFGQTMEIGGGESVTKNLKLQQLSK